MKIDGLIDFRFKEKPAEMTALLLNVDGSGTYREYEDELRK